MPKLKRSECAILPLVLKGKWFDMIERGEKKEEYRLRTDYWNKRIFNWFESDKSPHVIEFRHGYRRDARRMAFRVGNGAGFTFQSRVGKDDREHPEWGEPDVPHFALNFGERVELED